MDAFETHSDPVFGTTNIDFSDRLFGGIQQFRGYRQTRLTIGQSAVRVATEGTDEVLEKKIRVPDSWLRGFLQVQSAALLPTDTFDLSPIDLYNALRTLRMNRDIKGRRRGIRVELVPGQAPRMVLEPWETVIESSAGKYTGSTAKVIRVWGRRRLSMLRRMLPMTDSVRVHLTGSGLPSFWVLSSPTITMTLGLTGFTASNWAKALDFDLLLPRPEGNNKPLEKIVAKLSKEWRADADRLAKVSKMGGEDLIRQVQMGCQQGQLMYDLPSDVYRLRPLTQKPLDLPRLEYRSARERVAFDLVGRQNAVTITQENRIAGTGIELTGKAVVKEDRREYRPQLLIGDEGMVGRAECTCNLYRTQGLKLGPCAHLIALRLAHAERTRERAAGRETLVIDTKTFSRRDDDGHRTYQLSLDRSRIKIRWGRTGGPERVQQLRYDDAKDASEDYLGRIEKLVAEGYLNVE